MKRKIIKIDDDRCNGCGLCAEGCPEGAIQMIDGKARLVSELYCDGLGACIGECPAGAIAIEEREAVAYDEAKTMENIVIQGKGVIKAHLKHLKQHNQADYLEQAKEILKEKGMSDIIDEMQQQHHESHAHAQGGCPGSKMMDLSNRQKANVDSPNVEIEPQLQQWPIELHLLNPQAPYLKGADLLIAADCVPFAYPNFHQRFLKGKKLAIFCPKLDQSNHQYVEKLANIFKTQDINSLTIVHMEVPCCSATVNIALEALKQSGKNIIIKEYTISIDGRVI
ncbi:MAG: 4Fe-4S binding protein [Candidatus Omnitrophica bacterium]|nr:4Fe-4S binding protein [Candidatus Omnitrophota bacterium]